MKILGTGLTGLVGSRVVELLSGTYEFENISTSTGIDITNVSQVEEAITASDAELVMHFAAKTDVDGCESDKAAGVDGDAWKINVEGTRNVANSASKAGKKLIYISTEFIFDGEKEFYTEEDTPNPVNWYATTKYEGEKIVQSLSTPWVIARTSYPYRALFEKKDFVRAIKSRLESGEKIMGVTDHIFTPTFIDDVSLALDVLIKQHETGIYHVVGSSSLTPFEAAKKIAEIFSLDTSLIEQTTREEFFKGRAVRPYSLRVKNDKISGLGVDMKTFEEGLPVVKTQL